MSEWAETTLGDHLTRVRRKVSLQDGIKYAAVSVMKDGQGLGAKEPFVGGVTNYKTLYLVHEDDVVLRTITAFESPVGVAQATHATTHVSGVFLTYEVGPSLLPGYLRLFFQSPRLWKEMQLRATGTVLRRKTISDANFRAIPVPTPSLTEQRRIVEVMAAVDAQIEALAAESERLSRATTALGAALLTSQPHWDRVTIGDVAVTATGRAFPDRFQGEKSGVVPYFKVADMNLPGNQREMRTAPNWLTDESISEVKPRVCPAGTVLFPIIGAALRTEKRRILIRPSAFDQNIMGLILSERVIPDFMFAVMSNRRLGDLSQTGAVPSVNQKLVSAIEFALPPVEEQMAIGEQFRALYIQRESLEDELANLRALRSALLTSLLKQEVEIIDTYDTFLEGAS